MIWDPDEKERAKDSLREPGDDQVQTMTESQIFRRYLEDSADVALAHGVRKTAPGQFEVVDLDTVKRLPEWKKQILRGLVSRAT